jgi:uncharacterized protein HemY
MHGNYRTALEGYAKVLQSTKNPYWVRMSLVDSGYAHYALKQYGNTRQDFEASLRQGPENAASYRGLGLQAQKNDDITEATKNFERSVEPQPSPGGYLLLGQALKIVGQAQMTQDLTADIAAVRSLSAN